MEKKETTKMYTNKGWINKIWYIHTMEYNSTIEMNKL